jgi:hypothetical protein
MAEVLRGLAIGAALLGLGSGVGWWLRGPAVTSPREPPPAGTTLLPPREAFPQPRERVVIQAVDKGAIRDAVREAIGEELAAARAEDEAAEPVPAAETLVAVDSGQQYVQQAIGRGRWNAEDASRVRDLGAGLSAEQYQEMVRPLAIAINEGRVQLEVEGPPF